MLHSPHQMSPGTVHTFQELLPQLSVLTQVMGSHPAAHNSNPAVRNLKLHMEGAQVSCLVYLLKSCDDLSTSPVDPLISETSMSSSDKPPPNVSTALADRHAVASASFPTLSSLLLASTLSTAAATSGSMFNQLPPNNAFKVFHILVSLISGKAARNVVIGRNCWVNPDKAGDRFDTGLPGQNRKKLIREVVAFTSNYFSCNLPWPDHIRNTTLQHQDNNFSKRKKKCAKQRKPFLGSSQTQVINNVSKETG